MPFSYNSEKGTGINAYHIYVLLTSKNFLTTATNKEAIYHVDCTYRIIANRLPVLIFGRSDFSGQFFPMAVCIMSHETKVDFIRFQAELKSIILELFNFDFKLMFELPASYNIIKKLYKKTGLKEFIICKMSGYQLDIERKNVKKIKNASLNCANRTGSE